MFVVVKTEAPPHPLPSCWQERSRLWYGLFRLGHHPFDTVHRARFCSHLPLERMLYPPSNLIPFCSRSSSSTLFLFENSCVGIVFNVAQAPAARYIVVTHAIAYTLACAQLCVIYCGVLCVVLLGALTAHIESKLCGRCSWVFAFLFIATHTGHVNLRCGNLSEPSRLTRTHAHPHVGTPMRAAARARIPVSHMYVVYSFQTYISSRTYLPSTPRHAHTHSLTQWIDSD